MTAREAAEALGSDKAGLSAKAAADRLAAVGPNEIPAEPDRPLWRLALDQLKSPLIFLLLAAAAISVAIGERDDFLFILAVLAINTAIGAAQEWRAQANTAALRSHITMSARVRRDGTVRRVEGAALVPGDVVLLEAGDRVPADLRLLFAVETSVDESALTGESTAVDKAAGAALQPETPLADRMTMLYAGTTLQRGAAEGVVVATGAGTEIGRIAGALAAPSLPPPLTRRLARFSWILGLVAIVLVAGAMGLEVARGTALRETLLIAIALAVSVIPEGLPVAVTVALSIATRRMAQRNVIIRHLPAVEGLGACTVIATDKTGTLTVNSLTARRLWLPGHGIVEVSGEGLMVDGGFHVEGRPVSDEAGVSVRLLGHSGALCNEATLVLELGTVGATGDTVDLALLVLAAKAALDVTDLRERAPRIGGIPFAAERRFSASLHRHEDGHRLHVKGAAEVLLPFCTSIDRQAVLDVAEAMASKGYRVLAVASREISGDVRAVAADGDLGRHLDGLTLLGLVGFIDPLRPEAKDAVAACRRAGVSVKMITGDHAATALSIARELGIAQTRADVVTGAELATASPERIAAASVFARVEPAQKVAVVDALQRAGHVVAMTGDGVNDAPALKRADLGVAMGLSGTDVARDAADLVLADDNFASVVAGIEEGRAAYANIRKVIYLLVSTGAAEIVLFFAAILTGLPAPLTAVQLLWLNLVTNGGQDAALAFERREPDLMNRPPRPPNEPIFDRLMVLETALSGLVIGLTAWVVYGAALAWGADTFEARTVVLFLLVAFENAHVFNCRSETRSAFKIPLRHNWPLMVAVVAAQGVHIAAAYVPGLRDVLEIEPIRWDVWLALVFIAASVIPVMEGFKALRRRWR